MSRPPDDDLLNDVFSGEPKPEFRAASLERALGAVRQRRRRRKAMEISAALALVVGLSFFLKTLTTPPVSVRPNPAVHAETFAKENKEVVPGTHIRVLNDEELVAMFPNRPIAFIGPPNQRQLVFLDEQGNGGTHHSRN